MGASVSFGSTWSPTAQNWLAACGGARGHPLHESTVRGGANGHHRDTFVVCGVSMCFSHVFEVLLPDPREVLEDSAIGPPPKLEVSRVGRIVRSRLPLKIDAPRLRKNRSCEV